MDSADSTRFLSATALAAAYRTGELSPVDVATAHPFLDAVPSLGRHVTVAAPCPGAIAGFRGAEGARGAGAARAGELRAVTLEVTGDPVTEGRVERVLGWLGDYATNRWRLNGTRCVACPVASEALADLIDSSDFKIFGR